MMYFGVQKLSAETLLCLCCSLEECWGGGPPRLPQNSGWLVTVPKQCAILYIMQLCPILPTIRYSVIIVPPNLTCAQLPRVQPCPSNLTPPVLAHPLAPAIPPLVLRYLCGSEATAYWWRPRLVVVPAEVLVGTPACCGC